MKRILLTVILLLFLMKLHYAQNVNMVIQVNETLISGGLTNMYLKFSSPKGETNIPVDYIPGDLVMNKEAWKIINSDTAVKFSLHFDYNTYLKNRHETAHFYVDLSRQLLVKPYLILNVYDFRSKKYKRWYRSHTDNHFLAELVFLNSGVYIRKK